MMDKKRLGNWLKALISVVALGIVLYTVDVETTWATLRQADWRYILAALALYLLGLYIRAWRWEALLAAQGTQVPVGVLTRLYFVGTFFNNLLPSGIGGDVVKMYELSARSDDTPTAISTVLVDRALGLLVLFALALVTLPFGWRSIPLPVALLILGLTLGSVVAVWMFLNRALVAWLSDHLPPLAKLLAKPKIAAFYGSFHRYHGRYLWRALFFSLLFNLSLIAVVALIGLALHVRIGIQYYVLFVPIISTLLALPISLSGLGIREGGYVYLFTQVGVAETTALSMSLTFFALSLVTGLIGGIIYALENLRGVGRREEDLP